MIRRLIFFTLHRILLVIKPNSMKWVGHVARPLASPLGMLNPIYFLKWNRVLHKHCTL